MMIFAEHVDFCDLYLPLCHPPTEPGWHHIGSKHLWTARQPMQNKHSSQTHPREEVVHGASEHHATWRGAALWLHLH